MSANAALTNEIRNKIKSIISVRGMTLTSFINSYNQQNPDTPTTTQNITNKLSRGSLRLDEFINMMDYIDQLFKA